MRRRRAPVRPPHAAGSAQRADAPHPPPPTAALCTNELKSFHSPSKPVGVEACARSGSAGAPPSFFAFSFAAFALDRAAASSCSRAVSFAAPPGKFRGN